MKLLVSNEKLEVKSNKLRLDSKEYKFKEVNGITLITLVLTIIILIILAGVGINLSLGENGLFTKAKQARENYILTTNQEMLMLANLEKQIGNHNSIGNKGNYEIIPSDNGEYFFKSYNGYKNTLGSGKLNSFYGLTATKYEPDTNNENDGVNYCKYEKNLKNSFDISNKFEISFKSKFSTTSSKQMGGIWINFEKLNSENNMYENVISIGIRDAWAGDSDILTWIEYNKKVMYNRIESYSNKYSTIGIVGDGTNIKFYNDDTLLTTETKQDNLSFDKITIEFRQYKEYPIADKMYLERLYFGNIKYYEDIAK